MNPYLSLGYSNAQELHLYLPLFRPPHIIQKNRQFLLDHPTKSDVLDMLAHGLCGDWGTLPLPNQPVTNFLKSETAVSKCRVRFQKEISLGRMIGGPG